METKGEVEKENTPTRKKAKNSPSHEIPLELTPQTTPVPFFRVVDVLHQSPCYAKFPKEILSNNRKLDEEDMVMLTKECNAILQKKLPPKLKDPGSLTIPYTIGNIQFDRVIFDLGASVNLMPLFVFKKLGIGEVKPIMMCMQLTSRSITYPWGIVENVLVKVASSFFLADFVALNMEKDKKNPLILGRSFLAIGRMLINVQLGKLIMRV
ncbi:uncharacterized protein LOC116108098 [Pistacia vera]|uniref:uncharacterized protein LOC116108098 n=1 Tax=Pistacia vera TaxID=55513 RepID=UPI001262B9A2|nr:uncharacterized protein LOC116108098 [Pistacia vera]